MTYKCKIHGEPLITGTVQIQYGLVRLSPEFCEAQKTLFPNARSFILGGCVLREQKTRPVSYCQKCREAEATWLKRHEQ